MDSTNYAAILKKSYQMLGTWQKVSDVFGFKSKAQAWNAAHGRGRVPPAVKRKLTPLPLTREDPKRLAYAIRKRQ